MTEIRAVVHITGLTIGVTQQYVSTRSLQTGEKNGAPHGTSRTRNDLAHWEVAERHNAPLPPHNIKNIYRWPLYLNVPIRRLLAHPDSACCRLAPSDAAGFPHVHQAGVSGGCYRISVDSEI